MVPKTRMHKAHFEHNLKSLPKLVRLTPPGALTIWLIASVGAPSASTEAIPEVALDIPKNISLLSLFFVFSPLSRRPFLPPTRSLPYPYPLEDIHTRVLPVTLSEYE